MSDEEMEQYKKEAGFGDGSIGAPGFGDSLAAGQAAAANGDTTMADDDDDEQDLEQRAGLVPAPVATQFADEDEDEEDDPKATELKEKHPSLNSKSFAMKALIERRAGIKDKPDPYRHLLQMHDKVEAMPEGTEKKESIKTFNAVVSIFGAAREKEELRGFVADLFSAQESYYKNKRTRQAIAAELRILTKLYNDQEEEHMLAQLAERRKARMKQFTEKADAKAKKKEEAPAKRQKTGGD